MQRVLVRRLLALVMLISFAALPGAAEPASAQTSGPIILDLQASNSGQCTAEGTSGIWLFVEEVLSAFSRSVTRPGPHTVDVAVLGLPEKEPIDCSVTHPTAASAFANVYEDWSVMIATVAGRLGMEAAFYDGEPAARALFDGIRDGSVNPRVLYLVPKFDPAPDSRERGNELVAIDENAGSIVDFLHSGGGVYSTAGELEAAHCSRDWWTRACPPRRCSRATTRPGACDASTGTFADCFRSWWTG
jgi:hypothetical protein